MLESATRNKSTLKTLFNIACDAFNNSWTKPGTDGSTLAFYAAALGQVDELKKAPISLSDMLEQKDITSSTLLLLASQKNQLAVIKLFVENLGDNKQRTQVIFDALYYAITHGQLNVIKYCVSAGFDLECRITRYGNTALHSACASGYLRSVKYFVAKGVTINSLNDINETPVSIATRNGYLDIVEHMVICGADTTIKTSGGYDPMYLASINNHYDIVSYLKLTKRYEGKCHISRYSLARYALLDYIDNEQTSSLIQDKNTNNIATNMKNILSKQEYHDVPFNNELLRQFLIELKESTGMTLTDADDAFIETIQDIEQLASLKIFTAPVVKQDEAIVETFNSTASLSF